jgi:hypothetical protein
MTSEYTNTIEPSGAVPCFIDFEASSLSSESYPIEVAWNSEDGSIESHLISPEGQKDWQDWSQAAENVHRIERGELLSSGKSPRWIVGRMNLVLAGRTVDSDAPRFDGFWLSRLIEASGVQTQSFNLGDAEALFRELICGKTYGPAVYYSQLALLQEQARRKCPRQHRAAWDVEYLIGLFKLARNL